MELPRIWTDTAAHDGLEVPRPLRSGLAVAAVGLLPLVLGLTAVIRPLTGLVLAGIFVTAGGVQASLAYHELSGIRRRADRELRRKTQPDLQSTFARWRAGELTSNRHRTALARAVAQTVRDLSPARLPGASPLNRVAARPHAALFLSLADRLADLDRPVAPQAVLQIEELMTSSESPLYARERARELRASLLLSLEALDAELSPASSQTASPVDGQRERGLAAMTNGRRTERLGSAKKYIRRQALPHRRSRH